jgi:hypothetical protein
MLPKDRGKRNGELRVDGTRELHSGCLDRRTQATQLYLKLTGTH